MGAICLSNKSFDTSKDNENENLGNFPYVLNIILSHEILREEDKINGNFDDSQFHIKIAGKTYKSTIKYRSYLGLNFAFQIPLNKIKFDLIGNSLLVVGYFFKKDNFKFCGKFTLSNIKNDNLGEIMSLGEIELKNINNDKHSFLSDYKSFSFNINIMFMGDFLLDYLNIDSSDKADIFYQFLSTQGIFYDLCILRKRYFCKKAIELIFQNIKKISTEKDIISRDRYITKTLNKILKLTLYLKFQFISIEYSDLELAKIYLSHPYFLDDFLFNNLSYFHKDKLWCAMEFKRTDLLRISIKSILLAYSLGYLDDVSNIIENIIDDIVNIIELKERFINLIKSDNEFIELVLRNQSNREVYVLEKHLFPYFINVQNFRSYIIDNEKKFSSIFKNDKCLNEYEEVIFLILKTEFTDKNNLIKLISHNNHDDETIIKQFNKLLAFQKKLFLIKFKTNENFNILDNVNIRTYLFSYLNELDKQDEIEKIMNISLKKLIKEMIKIKNYSYEEIVVLLNVKFFIFVYKHHLFTDKNFDFQFSNNVDYFLNYSFKSVVIYYLTNTFSKETDNVITNLILSKGDYKNRLKILVDLNFIENYFPYILDNEPINPCNVHKCNKYKFLFSFADILNLWNNNKIYLNSFIKDFPNYDKLSECFKTLKLLRIRFNLLAIYGTKLISHRDGNDTSLKDSDMLEGESITFVFSERDNKEIYITHLGLNQKYLFFSEKSLDKIALFFSGSGDLPTEREINLLRDFNKNSDSLIDRFNYLGFIRFDDESKSNNALITNSINLVKSSFVIVTLKGLSKNDITYDEVFAFFGNFDKEESMIHYKKEYKYLSEEIE